MMNVLKAFAAGLTVGILFAPQSGLKTRKKIGKIFSDYKDDATDYLADAAEAVETKAKKTKKAIQHL